MIESIEIRRIQVMDFESIKILTNQLGSRISSDIVKDQIEEILQNPDHEAFVAIKNDQIVGYIHFFKAIRLTTKPFIEISGLVVDEKTRSNGIGKRLVEHIEKNYSENYTIRVRCNSKRELAHKFYLNLGYNLKKDQKIFEK